MKAVFAGLAAALSLSACATQTGDLAASFPVSSPQVALRAYYDTIPDTELPRASASPALNVSSIVSSIMVGSCINEELDLSPLNVMASTSADLTLLIGDNVYGDADTVWRYVNNEADLAELRQSFADLAADAGFQALRAARPMMVTWDDHDYGANDAGKSFPFSEFAERIHEHFWGLENTEASDHPGVYYSRIVGEEGKRLQIIMTDTRFFRSDLTPTPDRSVPGQERYIPSQDPEQAMLGEVQWMWLEDELKKPADLRLLVSSIQVTPDVHGWEAWSTMPKERTRLYELLKSTGADKNSVLVSGDRHTSFLYKNTAIGETPVHEITASSVNSSFAREPISSEKDAQQIGDGYAFTNFGMININWDAREVELAIHKSDGEKFSQTAFKF